MPDAAEGTAGLPGATSTRRTVVPGVAMVAVSFGLARYGYGLLLPEMQADLAISPAVAGLLASGTYVLYLVANAAAVTVTARLGARVTIGLAAASAAAGMTLMATATDVMVAAVGVLVAGAAAGWAFPPYADLVDRDVPNRRRDLAWSTISSGTGWGVALAGPVAIAAGDHWRLVWGLFAGIAVVVGTLAVRLAPAWTRRAAPRPRLRRSWYLSRQSRPLLVSAVLIGAGSSVWWTFSIAALRDSGLDPTAARTVYAVCGVAGIVASVAGALFNRTGLLAGYVLADVLLAAALAMLGLATSSFAVAAVAAALFGAFYNTVIAAQGIWSSRIFADHPAAGLAAVNTALTVGTLVGPGLAGAVIDRWGYAIALTGAAAITLSALAFRPPRQPGRTDRRAWRR